MKAIGEYLQAVKSDSSCDFGEWQARCYNNREGDLNQTDGIDCRECRNKGFVMDNEGTLHKCKCLKERANWRRIKVSGLRDLDHYTFRNYEIKEDWQRKVRDTAAMYAKNPQGWFFIGGQTGSGKTHISSAICRHLIREKKILYFCWRDEVPRLKAIVNDDPDEYAKRMAEVKEIEVLYIDDLFKTGKGGSPTEADVNLAFEILNYRYNAGLLTVISSEMTLGQIRTIDDAVAGRIAERAGNYIISIPKGDAKNYRYKGLEGQG